MCVEIYLYNLLDWGGGIEDTKYMTEDEAKKANQLLCEKETRLIRWAKSLKQEKYVRQKNNDQSPKA